VDLDIPSNIAAEVVVEVFALRFWEKSQQPRRQKFPGVIVSICAEPERMTSSPSTSKTSMASPLSGMISPSI
jgi:hypothetical protein